MRGLVAIGLIVALSGCYSMTPINMSQLAPGKDIGVGLSVVGSEDVAHYLGPNVQSVNGKLILETETALELGVRQLNMRSGQEQYWKGESVTIPKVDIADLKQRNFSWLKTGLVSAVLVGSVVALNAAGVIGGGNGSKNPPPKT